MKGIGIIGTGVIADFHAGAIEGLEEAVLTAVYDSAPARAEKFAEKWHTRACTDLQDFLAIPEMDIVAVCTPSGAHRDPSISAAAAGKHLLVEKPMEVTSARARDISEACRNGNVRLASVFQTRFHPVVRLLKQAVAEKWFGRISLVTAEVKWYRSQEYYDSSPWRGTWSLDGGGALMNQSIHVIDLLLWLFGDPGYIAARADTLCHTGIEVEDTLVASMVFPDGPLGTLALTTGAWPGSFKTLEICGELGHIRLEENRMARWDFHKSSPAAAVDLTAYTEGSDDVSDPLNIGYAAHRAQYLDLLHSIESGEKPEVGAEEAIAAVILVERIYASAGIGPRSPG